jgi:hypothetical protein
MLQFRCMWWDSQHCLHILANENLCRHFKYMLCLLCWCYSRINDVFNIGVGILEILQALKSLLYFQMFWWGGGGLSACWKTSTSSLAYSAVCNKTDLLMQQCDRCSNHVICIIRNRFSFHLKFEQLQEDITVILGFGTVYTSALNVEAACSSETFPSVCASTWCQNSEERRRHLPHRRGYLRSRIIMKGFSCFLVNPDEFRDNKM